MNALEKELDVMRDLARKAGELAMQRGAGGIDFESKADESPVTAADRECERLIARGLTEAFPDDGVLGEEGASKESRSGRRWIIDPIDGTRDFVRGIPVWSNLIALERDGEIVAGVANFPARSEIFFASHGGGAFSNDARVRVSGRTTVAQSVLCVTGLNSLAGYGFAPDLIQWMQPFWAVRCFGGCLDAMMVASGKAEIWIESSAKPWDFAPLKIIAEEAGARFCNFEGKPTIYGGNAVICVPALEAEVLRFVSRRNE